MNDLNLILILILIPINAANGSPTMQRHYPRSARQNLTLFAILFLTLRASFVSASLQSAKFALGAASPVALSFVPSEFGPLPPSGGLNRTALVPIPANACTSLSSSTANGYAISGSILLVTLGSCLRSIAAANAQAAGAVAVVFAAVVASPLDLNLDAPKSSAALGTLVTIPSVAITSVQFDTITTHLETAGNTATVYLPGSGVLDASDKLALRDFYQDLYAARGQQSLGFAGLGTSSDASGGLLPWGQLLTNYSAFDPCVNRFAGVYCVDGRIVSLSCFLCGAVGALPPSIGRLTALKELDFSRGNSLSGTLPCEVGLLANLTHLLVDKNQISDLSPCFNNLSGSLQVLSASSNRLTAVPSQLGQFVQLIKLQLSNNAIVFVPDLSLLVKLSKLDLSSNRISSALCSFAGMQRLVTLSLKSNRFAGVLNTSVFDGMTSLETLNVGDNLWSGTLPNLLSNPVLGFISFARNNFSGQIPLSWKDLSSAYEFSVAHNQLVSPILPFRVRFAQNVFSLVSLRLMMTVFVLLGSVIL